MVNPRSRKEIKTTHWTIAKTKNSVVLQVYKWKHSRFKSLNFGRGRNMKKNKWNTFFFSVCWLGKFEDFRSLLRNFSHLELLALSSWTQVAGTPEHPGINRSSESSEFLPSSFRKSINSVHPNGTPQISHRASHRFLQFFPGQGTFAVLVILLQIVNHYLRRTVPVKLSLVKGTDTWNWALCCHHLTGLNFLEMRDQFILRGAAQIDWTSENCGNSSKVTYFTKNTPGTSWNFAKHGTNPKPWVLDEMVKRPFVNVLGPPKDLQVLADLVADRNRSKKGKQAHRTGDASFRDENSKGQPAPKIAAMPVLFFRGVHPQNAHGIPEAFSPKSIWLGKVCEDRVDGGHDLLNFGTTGDRAKNPPGNLKEDIISISIRTLIERYHIMIIMFYLLVSTNYPWVLHWQSRQTPRTAAIRQLLEQRTVGLGEAWRSPQKTHSLSVHFEYKYNII